MLEKNTVIICLQKTYVWGCLKVKPFKGAKKPKQSSTDLPKVLPSYISTLLVWLAFLVGDDTGESGD